MNQYSSKSRDRFPGVRAVACSVALAFSFIATAQEPIPAAPPSEKAPAAAPAQHASNVVDYWYGPSYRTPFVLKPGTGKAADIARSAVEYSHISFWNFGSNFADIMLNQSDSAEPAANGGSGATELYATLRSDVSLGSVARSQVFHFGPLRDISAEVGANLETKNSSFAPSERTVYFGPKIQFAVPKGYFNVGLHLRKEWNHEGVLGRSESYHPDFNIEPTWLLPFQAGKLYLAYSGFADYNAAKGKDSFGTETRPEFLIRNFVGIDAGALLFRRAQLLDVNGGFWYWYNEYGKPASDPGAKQFAPMFGIALHLDGGRALHRP